MLVGLLLKRRILAQVDLARMAENATKSVELSTRALVQLNGLAITAAKVG